MRLIGRLAMVYNEDGKMQRPTFENKVNLNTILLAIALAGTGVGWGMTWSSTKKDIDQNTKSIAANDADIAALQVDIRTTNQLTANLQFRTTSLETSLSAVAAKQMDTDKGLGQLTTDVSVIKEIVQRLDDRERKR